MQCIYIVLRIYNNYYIWLWVYYTGPSVVAVHQNLHTCFIYMISRKVAFDVTTKVFAFMEDYTCTPMVTTVFNAKVQNTSSGNILWTNNSTDTQPTFFIPSMVFGSNEYGSVEGSDGKNVTSMTYNIQVAKNGRLIKIPCT